MTAARSIVATRCPIALLPMTAVRAVVATRCFMALLALTVVACEPPPVVPSADVRQQPQSARIEGEVVVQSAARGNVIVFLYDADAEPPPLGRARPLSFTVISRSALFDGAADGATGPFTAPYAFSLVSAGRYKLRALLDREGCLDVATDCRSSDFIPWFSVTNEPNKGDVGGGAVDPSTRAFITYEVTQNEEGSLNPVTGATVLIQDAATVPADRPAFRVVSDEQTGATRTLTLRLQPVDDALVVQRAPVFLVRWADDNADGVPDDANGDGTAEVYPRVVLRKLSDDVATGLTDENDLDRNGVVDETGVDYAHADGTSDGRPDVVVLPAVVDPTAFLPSLTDGAGGFVFNTVPATELKVIIPPVAFDVSGERVALQTVPKGRYSVTVVQFTGQTWRLPNELQPDTAPVVGLPTIESQQFTFDVK